MRLRNRFAGTRRSSGWPALVGVVALATFGVVGTGTAHAGVLEGTTIVNESFTGAGSTNWVLPAAYGGNQACLTASSDQTQVPIPGCSATSTPHSLRLTDDVGGQGNGVAFGGSLPSNLGLVASFDTYQYGPGNADGITFFVSGADPTTGQPTSSLGVGGGGLGYTPDSDGGFDGLSEAYLGVGLDSFGNFNQPFLDGAGCE